MSDLRSNLEPASELPPAAARFALIGNAVLNVNNALNTSPDAGKSITSIIAENALRLT